MGTAAILLAAGVGERFGGSVPKQFVDLGGKPVFLHALERLLAAGCFDEVAVVVPSGWVEKRVTGKAHLVAGGATRQESSLKGLEGLRQIPEVVLVHDGARPFPSVELIRRSVEMGRLHGAVDVCIPCADTLVYAPDGDRIESIPNRSHFLRGQTPQVFHYELLMEAHRRAKELGIENATDDCRLVLQAGGKVAVVRGEETNLKITTLADLHQAQWLLTRDDRFPLSGEDCPTFPALR